MEANTRFLHLILDEGKQLMSIWKKFTAYIKLNVQESPTKNSKIVHLAVEVDKLDQRWTRIESALQLAKDK